MYQEPPYQEYPYQGSDEEESGQYEDFVARSLYCPTCRMAMPVRERLLLVLPDGELYDYICLQCGESLGDKKVSKKPQLGI